MAQLLAGLRETQKECERALSATSVGDARALRAASVARGVQNILDTAAGSVRACLVDIGCNPEDFEVRHG
jgi:hypothetical protein